jgi:hypothetical protein
MKPPVSSSAANKARQRRPIRPPQQLTSTGPGAAGPTRHDSRNQRLNALRHLNFGGMRIGTDFGTTHTVTAVVDRGNYPVVSFDGADT